MPAIVLIRVDLPAPLSPTSAITSPRCTSRSTSVRACTDPNDFEMSWSSRTGVSSDTGNSVLSTVGAPRGAPQPKRRDCLAELLELTYADVALLEEAGGVDLPPVRLVERDRLDDVGGLF